MDNNKILRRIRYSLELDDSKMMALFALGGLEASRAQVSDWLKKDDDESFTPCTDPQFATFLNGLIIDRRGRKEGPPRAPETRLDNNQVFSKLKIALNMRAEAVLETLKLGGMSLSKHELSAFFRKPGHKHFRECKDQCLRAFLKGVQLQHRS
jgi:uncharacterized protein YehS (DUF1456 family)